MSLKSISLALPLLLFGTLSSAQDTLLFNFTGGQQTWTVPICVSEVEVYVAGASGGDNANYANSGGFGALLTGMVPVTTGDVLQFTIGQQGGVGNASGGFGGGGSGHTATGNYSSGGGGGATTFGVNGTTTMIAGAGGGAGGGGTSSSYYPHGGEGGCDTGGQGSYDPASWNPGSSPFADGGMGGTQVAAGAGGAPWSTAQPSGSPGVGNQGGDGGFWNTASGGGGGGGFFAGGGGGPDGCCTGANAGGGGGGGSSMWPIATIGCTPGDNQGDGYVMIIIPPVPEVDSVVTTDPLCFGGNDGEMEIFLTGGIPPYTYSIDNGATFQPDSNFTGLTSGAYNITIEDAFGCVIDTNAVITDPIPVTIGKVTNDTTICINGTATHIAAGAGAPPGVGYTYTWSSGASTTSINFITPAPAGVDYSVDVWCVSDQGCESDTVTFNVSHHAPIDALISANDSICPGYDTQQEVNTITGGHLGYNFSWTENGNPYPDNDNIIDINPSVNTEYCVTVTDGCETDPFTICTEVIMRNVPDVVFGDPFDGCVPSLVKLENLTSNVIVDSVTWMVNGVYYQGSQYNDSVLVSLVDVGEYDVYLEVYSIYGCHDAVTYTDYVVVHENPEPLFFVNPNPTTIFNTSVEMNNATPGAANTYQWFMPGGSPATSVLENPSVYYEEGVVGEYPVTLIATNEWGCVDSTSALVDVQSDVILYAPNIFTPDGDEFNEKWRVYIDGIDIYQFHLTLFNRWGEPVWESYNQIAEWNGTYGSGDIVPDGTYVWLLECKEQNNDRKHEFRGHVTVLK